MITGYRNSYSFNEFHLDVAERLLLREGIPISLPPRMFDLLALLVERNGHLVHKDELLRIVWEDAFVEEANVARMVHSLRKIFGETNDSKFIETVSKKGYRFVAEVTITGDTSSTQSVCTLNAKPDLSDVRIDDESQSVPRSPEIDDGISLSTYLPDRPPAEYSGNRLLIASLAGAFLIFSLLVAGAWIFNRFPTVSNSQIHKMSIAVLPVKPINNESRELIYELGIAESIIFQLNKGKSVKVRPLSAILRYSAVDQNAVDAGKEQQVEFVLSSNYQVEDGTIRVTSQLINVQDGSVDEVYKSESEAANKFLMQDAIANDIGNRLLARFSGASVNLKARRETSNEEAYRLYLRAGVILEEWEEPKLSEAIEYLEQAVSLDPNFAAAHVDLAYAYQTYQYNWSKTLSSEKEYYLKSKQAIETVLSLDENSANAHAVSGLIKSGYENDFAGAEKEFQRAIELDPDSIYGHGLYANFLIMKGRFDEALVERNKAIEINPALVVNHLAYGMILYNAHRYTQATVHFKSLLGKGSDSQPYFWLWRLADLQGNESEAYEWFIKLQTQNKTAPETIQLYQTAYRKAGSKGILREVIRQDEKIIAADNNPDLLYEIATFNALLGNSEKALEYLDKAYERRRSSLNYMKVDPALDSLHGDRRFNELVARVGFE
ncbi:MAG: winged helix-turn-helix domain-containing protein [Pyrinomonadaceae bacterium]